MKIATGIVGIIIVVAVSVFGVLFYLGKETLATIERELSE